VVESLGSTPNPIFVRPVGSAQLLVEKNRALAASLGGDLED
jgi:hypothetical protein